MKVALEALPVIEEVSVTRVATSHEAVEYKWIITFLSVYKNTPRGYLLDEYGEYEALIPHNHLIGTNTTILIGSKSIHSSSDVSSDSETAVQGQYGNQTGVVYIFQKNDNHEPDDHGGDGGGGGGGGDVWQETVTIIRGNDTNPGDQFGYSVTVDQNNILVIGAIGAETNGIPEIQSLHCDASQGTWLGHKSNCS
jgi:hypothetical protein